MAILFALLAEDQMGNTAIAAICLLTLCACGGGGLPSATPWSITNPPAPNPAVTFSQPFSVVQADLATAAVGVPIYVNEQACSQACDQTLTTDAKGNASATIVAWATYCISLSNPGVSLATAPATASYEVGTSGIPYLVNDTCLTWGGVAIATINMAE